MKCKCPVCNGSGKISIIEKPTNDSLKKAAKKLRKNRYTIRQIAASLGFKHPGSVSHLLK